MNEKKLDTQKEKKKENLEEPVNILQDIQIASSVTIINYIQTKKGIFIWGTPYALDFEEHFKIIDYIKEKTIQVQNIKKEKKQEFDKIIKETK